MKKLWTTLVGGPFEGERVRLTSMGGDREGPVCTAPLAIRGERGRYTGQGATDKRRAYAFKSYWEPAQ